ncbi:hypothetical protein M8C21_016970 [Ambrosia artemisiifolia]|uniref:Uncharacterized protein n=1 Tax=Ambrosia artemisiifolia TaxID=4212 RepID=A0AAD5D1U6_AMBAR|nr:hypothetical protein M8C21_016970 [Ambrosia artemisiifolia]
MADGNNIGRPKWRGVSVQACSAEDVDVGVEVKSQVQVHDGSSSGSLAESSSSKMASSTDKHSISLEGPRCFASSKENGALVWLLLLIIFVASSDVANSLLLGVPSKTCSNQHLKPKDYKMQEPHRGSMQAKIEEETGTKLIFPSSRKEETLIIEGASPDSVGRASERIQLLIDEVVKSPALDYSHFISLPLALHPQLIDKLINFQNSILGVNDASSNEVLGSSSSNIDDTNEDSTMVRLISYPPKSSATSTSKLKTSTLSELGIDKSIFINPKTFHLTVLMLKLWNKERVNNAIKIFKGIEAEVMDALDGRPVSIKLTGLDCMKGSFAKARVLYAPVEVVGEIITNAFIKGGLVLERDAKHTLKLHATVMNTRQRKRRNDTRKFDGFDARGIMEQYGSEEWGEYVIPELHLSQRFVYDENGYYHCCASFPLPKNMQAD